jgi:hypothetical protein
MQHSSIVESNDISLFQMELQPCQKISDFVCHSFVSRVEWGDKVRRRVQWSHCSVVDMDFFNFTVVVKTDQGNMMLIGILVMYKTQAQCLLSLVFTTISKYL